MKHRVARYIAAHHLLESEKTVLVALSGGADSVALLRLLLELGYPCQAAHCNFHLRGAESDRDEAFAEALCRELDVPLHTVHFDTAKTASELRLSIEMAARKLRYDWFDTLSHTIGAQAIAVAHHRDDSVETLLLNLLRGTGIDGLRGIRPRNGNVVRPLLCVSREEIVAYLDSLGQPYVTDSTNLQDEYTRNKIRLKLIPLMKEINPSIQESLMKTARRLDQAATLYHLQMDEARRRVCSDRSIRIDALLKEPEPEALLHELLSPLGFNEAQQGDIFRSLTGEPGRSFVSATHRVIKDRDYLLTEPLSAPRPPELHIERHSLTDTFRIPRSPQVACLDADKLKHPLSLRLCQAGDWFIPLGMKGKKNVAQFLTDRKIPLHLKQRQWLLCCGDDIVWVVGQRIDQRFCIDALSQSALVISVSIP